MNFNIIMGCLILSFVFLPATVAVSSAISVVSRPARIGGTVIVDGTQITQATDAGYTFVSSKQNANSYVPAAEDNDGLNASDWYVINIPIYDPNNQPGGANPGDTALIHVYKDGSKLSVTSPYNGQFSVGASGSSTKIDLSVNTAPPIAYVEQSGECQGKSPCFAHIQEAIDSAGAETEIKTTGGEYYEDIMIGQNSKISLLGGWNSSFTSQGSNTIINGKLEIGGNATVIVGMIILSSDNQGGGSVAVEDLKYNLRD